MSLGTWRLQADLAAARAEIERLNNGLTDAACQISDLASRLGRAEGRLDASELVGVVEGWKARAEKAESERDEARAQVAAAYETAAEKCDVVCQDGVGDIIRGIGDEILALTPTHAQSALEAYGREKVREGMKRAYELSGQYHQITHIRAAILADMETLK